VRGARPVRCLVELSKRASASGLWSRRPRVRVPSLPLFVLQAAIFCLAVDRARGKREENSGLPNPLVSLRLGRADRAVEPDHVARLRVPQARIPEAVAVTQVR
jgi:hypothetical protein